MKDGMQDLPAETDIAIVGMAAHLPGAADIQTYWENLREGRSAVRRLTEEEIGEVLKVSPRTVRSDWRLARSWLLRELDQREA